MKKNEIEELKKKLTQRFEENLETMKNSCNEYREQLSRENSAITAQLKDLESLQNDEDQNKKVKAEKHDRWIKNACSVGGIVIPSLLYTGFAIVETKINQDGCVSNPVLKRIFGSFKPNKL